jgi:hypothetical protein
VQVAIRDHPALELTRLTPSSNGEGVHTVDVDVAEVAVALTFRPKHVRHEVSAGANPDADGDRGMSALRRARRAGKSETVALLVNRGATDDSTDIDLFIGACLRADRRCAEQLLAEHPDLRDRLTAG